MFGCCACHSHLRRKPLPLGYYRDFFLPIILKMHRCYPNARFVTFQALCFLVVLYWILFLAVLFIFSFSHASVSYGCLNQLAWKSSLHKMSTWVKALFIGWEVEVFLVLVYKAPYWKHFSWFVYNIYFKFLFNKCRNYFRPKTTEILEKAIKVAKFLFITEC